ncbi:hypothetical protein SETIT_6G123700v2 [Setaria italica]|uniref:Uncharacterized protein n=1 Tax=Setaria italica TaxID=4555 RepID=A0A368RKR8_SETIT|nr:hypothetical protein SETIT_6G123700v2 [Setaria italica]
MEMVMLNQFLPSVPLIWILCYIYSHTETVSWSVIRPVLFSSTEEQQDLALQRSHIETGTGGSFNLAQWLRHTTRTKRTGPCVHGIGRKIHPYPTAATVLLG